MKHTKPKRVTLIINNMKLIDIPPHQMCIYGKVKQATEATTQSVKVVNNQAVYQQPLSIDCDVPQDPNCKNIKPLRFSFRLETKSLQGFTRYGIAEIDLRSLLMQHNYKVHILLQNCVYNTCFECNVQFPFYITAAFPQVSSNGIEMSNSGSSHSDDFSASISNDKSQSLTKSQTTTISTTNLSTTGSISSGIPLEPYEMAPVSIDKAQYLLLENQINGLLASIITKNC